MSLQKVETPKVGHSTKDRRGNPQITWILWILWSSTLLFALLKKVECHLNL